MLRRSRWSTRSFLTGMYLFGVMRLRVPRRVPVLPISGFFCRSLLVMRRVGVDVWLLVVSCEMCGEGDVVDGCDAGNMIFLLMRFWL